MSLAEVFVRLSRPVPPPEPEAVSLYSWGDTDDWPDPYGPDPVVFGREPRFKNPMD